MANAIANYNKCMKLYTQVPEGFLRHKNSAGTNLLGIYKTLSIYTRISNLQNQLQSTHHFSHRTIPQASGHYATESIDLGTKKERAKKNIQRGLYDEASKDIEEVLKLEPKDAEAKAIHAKLKTLQ